MEADYYDNLSPLDHRYRSSSPDLFAKLSSYLSERSTIQYLIQVELALLKTHLLAQGYPTDEVEAQLAAVHIEASEVYREEEKTRHNIRALVNVLTSKVPADYARFVHLGATSTDIVDTAAALRLRDVTRQLVLPLLYSLEENLIALATREAATPQVGRTHGQFAVPISLGFAMAAYVSRLGQSIEQILAHSNNLRGKLSGAVGGYNATSLISPDPIQLEEDFLASLGLKAAEYSNQIVMPEYQLRLLQEINLAFGVIANLADDLRHLQRSEIDEVREYFSPSQVGSSTMPQKRNPWNCEHVKSLWKAFSPRIMSFYMDQISEHQRDLSNSASGRFVSDYISGFCFAVSRMDSIVQGLGTNSARLESNLQQLGDSILAEPIYIMLAMGGVPDAHEEVRLLTLEREKSGKSLVQLLKARPELEKVLIQQLKKAGYDESLLSNPSLYMGRCKEKTLSICHSYQSKVPSWKAQT